MKIETKLKLAATAAAVLVTGLLSQTANANVIVGDEYDATLTDQGPGLFTGSTFTLESFCIAPLTGGNTSASDYLYFYYFPNSPDAIASVSVYFDTAAAGANTAQGGTLMTDNVINAGNVNWQFNPNMNTGMMDFLSPIAPTLGYATAQDGGLWGGPSGGGAFGVVIPAVPDSGTTLSLLGGALVGIGALRRKFSC